ncbi:hypothetical protein H2199_003964 [Coniosporium tulheliwenetii]|uniref:Uncharacterized protein n=1 Tax=Coniosporium tulheliwenetii TaxID=3383036 RepID=A0ACC2Z8I8_9PEZI|nr:hypothetical protein H2199_003964 [Cladosporium sp. JES 115]
MHAIIAVLRFTNDPEYSDLTVRCGREVFYVHKYIVCNDLEYFKKACSGKFKEGLTNVIELYDDEPSAIKLMLEWIYSGDLPYYEEYNHPPNFHSTTLDRFRLYAATYVAADKYGAEALKAEIERRFRYCCYHTISPQELVNVAHLVYSSVSDQQLHSIVAVACVTRLTELLTYDGDGSSLKALLEEFEELWKDLAQAHSPPGEPESHQRHDERGAPELNQSWDWSQQEPGSGPAT